MHCYGRLLGVMFMSDTLVSCTVMFMSYTLVSCTVMFMSDTLVSCTVMFMSDTLVSSTVRVDCWVLCLCLIPWCLALLG